MHARTHVWVYAHFAFMPGRWGGFRLTPDGMEQTRSCPYEVFICHMRRNFPLVFHDARPITPAAVAAVAPVVPGAEQPLLPRHPATSTVRSRRLPPQCARAREVACASESSGGCSCCNVDSWLLVGARLLYEWPVHRMLPALGVIPGSPKTNMLL